VPGAGRRGRGHSGDTPPWAVDREAEDVAALIEAVGGAAALYTDSPHEARVCFAALGGHDCSAGSQAPAQGTAIAQRPV